MTMNDGAPAQKIDNCALNSKTSSARNYPL